MNRRQLCIALAWLLESRIAKAGEVQGNSYSVISCIGDQLDIVTHEVQIGSHIDRNHHDTMKLGNASFDSISLRAVNDSILQHQPTAKIFLLGVSAPDYFTSEPSFLSGRDFKPSPALESRLRSNGSRFLVLVTKHRGEASFRARTSRAGNMSSVGGGKIEGLGFYVDDSRPTFTENGERLTGYLAPFAYISISLIDLATSTVIKEQPVEASRLIPRTNEDADGLLKSWLVLTPADKVEIMRGLLTEQISDRLPSLLEPA